MIDISKLDKADVLIALYNRAKVQGMGFIQATSDLLTKEEANKLLGESKYFDYLFGRVMKVDLKGFELDEGLYDRDNGQGAALSAISSLLKG